MTIPFKAFEYMGTELYPLPDDFDHSKPVPSEVYEALTAYENRILLYEALKPGMRVLAWGWIISIVETTDGTLRGEDGRNVYILDHDQDDRHCWICTSVVSKKALAKFSLA